MMLRGFFPVELSRPADLIKRLRNSAVAWSWIFNGLRLASGLILLPLVFNKLPVPELGMYIVLLTLVALVPLVDFGFAPTIARFVSYAMAGAESIQPQGMGKPGARTTPNYPLLWQLLCTTRVLYRYLTLVLLIVLGLWGTYTVELRVNETASPLLTRFAWGVTLVSAVFEIYSNWWANFLRGMNEVLVSARISVAAQIIRLLLAAGLLLLGGGLLSLPLGTLVSSILARYLARRRCLLLLAGHPSPAKVEVKEQLRVLWPNTWRQGIQLVSGYLTVNANTTICLYVFGLTATARYGPSIQLLNFISGMAAVWTAVKWPMIGQFRARHDHAALQRLLWPRVWLQNVTFVFGAGILLAAGPFLLATFGSGKQLLPLGWLGLLTLNAFLEMQFNVWGTLLSTENRLPYLWPTVATNVLSFIITLALIYLTSLGIGALVLGPFLAGIVFNYWYWPPFAARNIGTTLFRFLFTGPAPISAQPAPMLTGSGPEPQPLEPRQPLAFRSPQRDTD